MGHFIQMYMARYIVVINLDFKMKAEITIKKANGSHEFGDQLNEIRHQLINKPQRG